jgi:transcription antitermination factor NusG
VLWFAVQVAPQHEQKVALLLQYKGYEQFLPTRTSRRHWSDRIKILKAPLFPGYIFCRAARSSFGAILNTRGVHRIVCFGGRPCPIPEVEIKTLQKAVESGKDVIEVPYLSAGQRVKIAGGPLAGVIGIVTRQKNSSRLIVSIEIIMRSISVEIASSDLIALDPAS